MAGNAETFQSGPVGGAGVQRKGSSTQTADRKVGIVVQSTYRLVTFRDLTGAAILLPAGGGGEGYVVSTHMLNSAATYLHSEAMGMASSRDAFNAACYMAEGAFGNGYMTKCFNDFFSAWFTAFDDQAETLDSAADATQQCAVLYDHAERSVIASIRPMSVPKPAANPPPQQPSSPFVWKHQEPSI